MVTRIDAVCGCNNASNEGGVPAKVSRQVVRGTLMSLGMPLVEINCVPADGQASKESTSKN